MFGLFKEWDQSARNQTKNGKNSDFSNFMEPVIPQGKTVDEKLKSLQSNPLYNDQNDRRLFNHVTEEYKRAYPGNMQLDEFGKMQRPSKPSIQPDQVRAFDPDGVLQKTRQISKSVQNKGMQAGTKQPVLPGAADKPMMSLSGQKMSSDDGVIPKLGKPIIPLSKKPLQQSVKQPQTNPLMNALTGKQDKNSLGQRKTPMRKPQAEQEIGFGTGRGDFVTGVDAHDEDVNDLIAQTKVPQGVPHKIAEQQQAMAEHQRQNRMPQYEDIAEEGYDMSDADLEGSGIETMDQMIAGGMSKEQYTQQLAAEQRQRRDAQIARSNDLKVDAEDLHGVDLHASGEDTMEDMTANAMTKAEYQRHQAAQRMHNARQQAELGQEAQDDADDMAGFKHGEMTAEDYVRNQHADPAMREFHKAWNKKRDATQAGFDSGISDDFKDTADYIRANMKDPKFKNMLKPQTWDMFQSYEKAKESGLSEEAAQDAAYETGAQWYMDDAASASVSGTWHKSVAGFKAMGRNSIDMKDLEEKLARGHKGIPERYLRTKTFQNTEGAVNFATDVAGTVIKPIGALKGAGDVAYEVARSGGDAEAQQYAALTGATIGGIGGSAANLATKGIVKGGIRAAGKTALGRNAKVQAAAKATSKAAKKFASQPGMKDNIKIAKFVKDVAVGQMLGESTAKAARSTWGSRTGKGRRNNP